MANYGSQQQANVQVVIMDDQNKSLQELFSAPFMDSSQQKQVPLYQRKLPKSFFVQPNESQGGDKNIPLAKENSGSYHLQKNASHIHHSKAHSSPACLDASYLNNLHPSCESLSPHSFDIKQEDVYNQKLSPHQKKLYSQTCSASKYPSSRDQLPKAKDSHRRHPPAACGNPQSNSLVSQMKFQICEMPQFYEAAVNEENRVYFLNHQTQNTSWFDPRLPENFQKWGMTVEELEHRHYAYYRYILERQQTESNDRNFNHQMSGTVHTRSFSQPTPMQGVASVGTVAGVCSPGPLSSLSSSSSLTGGQPGAPPITQVLEGLHLTGPQHSHQGSIDSGVGQSVTGQTPEHALQIYEQGGMPTEFMEGVNYGGNETPFSDINLLDGFDISDLNSA